jgi:NADPH:quinone reductase-like Zn-dependent oxidoreductase
VKVVHLTGFGGPEVLQPAEAPDPEPRPGHVVVDLERAALNHRDVWIREGRPGPLPAILGSDGAGVVSAVGPGVESVSPGDEVVINPSLDWGDRDDAPGPDFRILGVPDQGTYAERIVIAAHQVRPRPAGWSWDECAAFPLGGLTAWRALRLAGAGPGRRILVTGAAGGVGTFLVQIGAALGATIVATTGSAAKIARVRELGAAEAVDYHDPDWPRRIGPVHAAIDSAGGSGLDTVIGTLARGGVLVSFGDTARETATVDLAEVFLEWRAIQGTTMGSPREFDALLEHIATARWRPVIDSTFALADAAEAHRRLVSPERTGKVVLAIR